MPEAPVLKKSIQIFRGVETVENTVFTGRITSAIRLYNREGYISFVSLCIEQNSLKLRNATAKENKNQNAVFINIQLKGTLEKQTDNSVWFMPDETAIQPFLVTYPDKNRKEGAKPTLVTFTVQDLYEQTEMGRGETLWASTNLEILSTRTEANTFNLDTAIAPPTVPSIAVEEVLPVPAKSYTVTPMATVTPDKIGGQFEY